MAASRSRPPAPTAPSDRASSVTPKWKMLAASAASALPRPKTSAKCAAEPAPPLAITGICTASLTAAVSSQSKPSRIPSVSMLVSRISPAPRDSASRAHSTTRRPVGLRPPLTYTSASSTPFAPRRASIATITACAPKLAPISPISSGRAIAAELMLTLSAPALKTAAASSAVRMPPPTVKGTKSFARRAPHSIEQRTAALVRGRDVEQHDLVGARRRMAMRQLRRVARVDDVDKLHALHNAPAAHIQTGNNSLGQHLQLHKVSQHAQANSADFSGWNCTPITFSRSTAAVNAPP